MVKKKIEFTEIPLKRYDRLGPVMVDLDNACKHSIFKKCTSKCKSYQPERSKREDLDCCNKIKELERLLQIIIDENIDCGEFHSDYVSICEIFINLITEAKMRCSEHCGNTVRDK